MAWVDFSFCSNSGRPLLDRPDRVKVKERIHAAKRWTQIKEFKRGQWRGKYNARAHHFYCFEFRTPGFRRAIERFKAQNKRMERHVQMQTRIATLPSVQQLSNFQKNMLTSLDSPPAKVWSKFSDNQCATFFQVTYVLEKYGLTNGETLANCVKRLLRVGGSEIKCPNPKRPNSYRTVKGWRLHVEFRSDCGCIKDLLEKYGFRRDGWPVHGTHTDCGYTTSFRASVAEDIRLQVCLSDKRPWEADVDVDIGDLHKSAPWHVCGKLNLAYGGLGGKYEVE